MGIHSTTSSGLHISCLTSPLALLSDSFLQKLLKTQSGVCECCSSRACIFFTEMQQVGRAPSCIAWPYWQKVFMLNYSCCSCHGFHKIDQEGCPLFYILKQNAFYHQENKREYNFFSKVLNPKYLTQV